MTVILSPVGVDRREGGLCLISRVRKLAGSGRDPEMDFVVFTPWVDLTDDERQVIEDYLEVF